MGIKILNFKITNSKKFVEIEELRFKEAVGMDVRGLLVSNINPSPL